MTEPQPIAAEAPPPPPTAPFWNWLDAALFLGLAAPSLLLALAMSRGILLLFPQQLNTAMRALLFQFLGYAIWFLALWVMLRFRYERSFWGSMAWNVPWPRMGFTLFLGPLLVITVLILGELMGTPNVDNAIQRLLQDRLSILLVGFFAVTLGPLAEELVFRGFLQPLLIHNFGPAIGILAASLPFALLHGPQYNWSWQHILLLTFASVVFGLTRWRSGSTAASTLVHATYNLTFYTAYLLQRKDIFL